eukprot:NODE_106_length_19060_cov_0.700227.p7 type:complete len:360 gc:universal NODE_106_length_19060_cov_0.700227:17652-18731(+)
MSFFIGLMVGVLLAYLIPVFLIYRLPKDKVLKYSEQEAASQVVLNTMTCSCIVNNTPCTIQLHKGTLLMSSMHKSCDVANSKIYYHNEILIIQSHELFVIKFLSYEEMWVWYMALIQRTNQYKNSSMPKAFLKFYAHSSMVDPNNESRDSIFNIIAARQFIAYVHSRHFKESQLAHFSERFNSKMKSDYFQSIKITHLEYGEPPKFHDIKVVGLEEDGTVMIDGNFEYSGLQMVLEVCVNLKVPGFNYFTSASASKEITDASHTSGFLLNLSFNFTLKNLKGKMLFKFPSLPINHLFYGFYADPIFEVAVEPKVSNRQVKIAVLGGLLEKRIMYFHTYIVKYLKNPWCCRKWSLDYCIL